MTRIVEKASKAVSFGAMEQTKASKNVLQVCLFLIALISLTLVAMQLVVVGSCSKLVMSVTEHLVEVVDKLSTTVVVFFRSESSS